MNALPPPRPHSDPQSPQPSRLGDPLLDERLARLAARRNGHAVGGVPASARTTAPAAHRSGRSHPARGSRAAALALSVSTTIGLAAYLQQAASADDSSTVSSGTISASTATTAATAATTASSAATEVVAVETATDSSTGLADGTYTGDTSTNRWGDVQVQVTVTDGVITDITVLQYPDGEHESVEINQRALPTLIESTLTAQSADVDTVSGATYTSESYRESLQTAIDDARAAATA